MGDTINNYHQLRTAEYTTKINELTQALERCQQKLIDSENRLSAECLALEKQKELLDTHKEEGHSDRVANLEKQLKTALARQRHLEASLEEEIAKVTFRTTLEPDVCCNKEHELEGSLARLVKLEKALPHRRQKAEEEQRGEIDKLKASVAEG